MNDPVVGSIICGAVMLALFMVLIYGWRIIQPIWEWITRPLYKKE